MSYAHCGFFASSTGSVPFAYPGAPESPSLLCISWVSVMQTASSAASQGATFSWPLRDKRTIITL